MDQIGFWSKLGLVKCWIAAFVVFAIGHSAYADYKGPITCPGLPALTGDTTTSAGSCATINTYHLISTLTANNSASLAWTGLGSTYLNYQLICSGLYPATNNASVGVQFGEGGTPTWETGSTAYKWMIIFTNSNNGASAPSGGTSGSGDSSITLNGGGMPNTAAGSANVNVMLYGLPTAGITHGLTSAIVVQDATPKSYIILSGGQYVGDTNAITAVRVIAASGNLTAGSCTLVGLGP